MYVMKYIFSNLGQSFKSKGGLYTYPDSLQTFTCFTHMVDVPSPTDSYIQKDVKFHLCIVNLIIGKTKRYGSFQQHGKVSERKVGQLNSYQMMGTIWHLAMIRETFFILHSLF